MNPLNEDQGDTVIKEATLPVENDICPVEVGDRFCMLFEEPEYSLPFEVVALDAAVKEAAAQMLDDVVAKYRERRRSARGPRSTGEMAKRPQPRSRRPPARRN